MKIPLSWIKRFISTDKSPEEIADLLTLAGIEVEKIDRSDFSFEGVVIGHVKEVHPHENADKLRVAKVSDGKTEHNVVCGAPNLTLNRKVAFAPIGSVLEKDSSDPFKIRKAKLRGVESRGMLCSEKELGIGNDHDGIILLDDAAPVGEDFITYYKDPIFDVTLTPNLGHCRSILGIARELSRYCEKEVTLPEVKLEPATGKNINDLISVTNELKDKCRQYAARVITGLEVKPSPAWMRDLLEKAGITQVNNVVDITNYVLHELGQPLHAFDYATLPEKNLTVRDSKEGEELTTLDGKERILNAGHIVISSNGEPVAIGGIMGGESTSITTGTHTVVLEAAEFCASQIRKSSRELKLRSESSSRFENQIDSGSILFALDYAAYLMQEIAGGSIVEGVIHEASHPFRPSFLTVRLSRINKILGTSLSLSEVESFLLSLGFAATTDGTDLFQLKTPSWRNDVKTEIDIIEEVARVYGFNNITTDHPKHVTSMELHHPLYVLQRMLRGILCGEGLQEFLTCSLVSKEQCSLGISHGVFEVNEVEVLHAKSVDQSFLRPSLLPGMLASMAHNKNNGCFDISAFELGEIFSKSSDGFSENPSLGVLLAGNSSPHHFSKEDRKYDFYDMKGILQNLLSSLFIENTTFERSSHKTFHPGIQANVMLNGEIIATFGKVHPQITSKMKLAEETFFAEVSVFLLEKHRVKHTTYKALPTLPSSYRDITFSMKKEKELTEILGLLEKAPFPELKESKLRNIYIDEKNHPDKKNVTFRFVYRGDVATIDDAAISKCHENVITYLSKAL